MPSGADPGCDVIELSEIDLGRLRLVKEVVRRYGDQDHSRWIFAGSLGGRRSRIYVKLWNPTYVRRDNLLRGLAAGFYDATTAPALQALVFSAGLCRGYVMARCRRHRGLDPEFYRLVCARTAETGHFAVQFSPFHAMRHGGRFSLIDLEGVYPVEQLGLVAAHHSAFAHAPYAQFVSGLFAARFPDRGSAGGGVRPPVEDPPPRWRRAPLRRASHAWRRRVERIGARLKARTHLIER